MSSPKLNCLIVLLGPTASGKSSLAVKLAKRFNGEIVSADSRQIYKELNIGTAKISSPERDLITHHLLDLVYPDQAFSLSQYQRKAQAKINQIQKRKKLPFLVGGTGLYLQAVVDNLDIPKIKPNPKLREKIEADIAEKGLASVYQRLIKLDPNCQPFIDPKNPRRIIRALEVCLLSKKPFSLSRKKRKNSFSTLQLGLKIPLDKLDKRIDHRVEKMFQLGLIGEVETLFKKYPPQLPAFSGIGYSETIAYLQKKITKIEAKQLIKQHSRQYARRQLTWFKKDPRIIWINNLTEAKKITRDFLEKEKLS